MAIGFSKLQTLTDKEIVTLTTGAGTLAVVFDPPFIATPAILVVPDRGDEAAGAVYTFEPTTPTPTKLGFTIKITASGFASEDVAVIWFAHEKA